MVAEPEAMTVALSGVVVSLSTYKLSAGDRNRGQEETTMTKELSRNRKDRVQ